MSKSSLVNGDAPDSQAHEYGTLGSTEPPPARPPPPPKDYLERQSSRGSIDRGLYAMDKKPSGGGMERPGYGYSYEWKTDDTSVQDNIYCRVGQVGCGRADGTAQG